MVYLRLPHRKGNLTIAELKSLHLSGNVVVSLPLESILSKIFRYAADLFIEIYQMDIIMKIMIFD
jgi:hypothetical protein